jgi:uncharacterized protein (DUF1810 family)
MALDEIRAGRKTTHWVWYVFPQVEGLGTSPMNQIFSISTIIDAQRFLNDEIVGKNFELILDAAVHQLESGCSLASLMNGDEYKFVSCITLMQQLADTPTVVELTNRAQRQIGNQGYSPCHATLQWLDEQGISRPSQ